MSQLTASELLASAISIAIPVAVPVVAILLFLGLFRKLNGIEEKVDAIRQDLKHS